MPKNILLISHTEESLKYHPSGVGEITHSAKLEQLLRKYGRVERKDLYSFFPDFSLYESYAKLNMALAEEGHDLLELETPCASSSYDLALFFTWSWGIAGLAALGIQKLQPTAMKLYVFHKQEKIFPKLYEKADLLITESLLANQRGIYYGIPDWKMIYLPHQYPENIEEFEPDRSYLERLAKENAKPLFLDHKSVVVGIPGRIESRKNVGFALSALYRLSKKGKKFICVLKGNFASEVPPQMEFLQKEPWFFWDRKRTPFPEVLREYATFDLALHLSGYEGASNTVVELLALGKPTFVLEGTTNPYLFREGAFFIPAASGFHGEAMPYQIPSETDLEKALEAFLDDRSLREKWGKKAKQVAEKRFHPSIAQKRLPLILEGVEDFRKGNRKLQGAIQKLYQEDLAFYGL